LRRGNVRSPIHGYAPLCNGESNRTHINRKVSGGDAVIDQLIDYALRIWPRAETIEELNASSFIAGGLGRVMERDKRSTADD
jgi:hypothetical protein